MSTAANDGNLATVRAGALMLFLLLLAASLPVRAELGADVTSVASDQARMKASLRIQRGPSYSVHEIQMPTGTLVREYVSAAGKVFGVSWQGPWMPDLRGLLGAAYFEQFAQTVQRQPRRRAPVSVEQPGLVVQSAGRPRAFFGRAYVPEMLPPGVGAEAIQ